MTRNELISVLAQSNIDDETAGRMAAAMIVKPAYHYMTMREYADKFRVSKRTVERAVAMGKLPVDKLMKCVRIKVPVE